MGSTFTAGTPSEGDSPTASGRGKHRVKARHAIPVLPGRFPESLLTICLVVVAFLQRPGRIVRDTKLDLSIDPGRFLSDATHLWDPNVNFGSVPNQAYGYLFPLGPFYWLGSSAHLPEWIIQRLWLGLLLIVATWGTVFLAEAMRIGGRWSRLAGGAAYALSPFLLVQIHDTAYVIPAVLLPWVILPLVRVEQGRLTPGAGAARSGLAVLLMGGINATEVAAVLVLPVLWFATRRPVRRQARLFVLWLISVGLATAWFVLPLLFQAKYWFNAVPYTETANTTTATSSIAEVLRGAGIWTSFSLAPTWTTAGLMIESNPAVIVASALIAATGLYGLARREMPQRNLLATAVLLGVGVVCSGYWGPFGGPLAVTVHAALDGPLAVFRNIAKFQPVITLALVLGFVHAVEHSAIALVRSKRLGRRPLQVGLFAVTAATVALVAGPALTGQIYPEGSFVAIPAYWHQAVDWLNTRGGMSTTLLIPGNAFADLSWGNPLDQPIQPLASVPWANRAIAPLGSVGNTQFLDSIDRVLASGQPESGLAPYLARAGVRYLLVENDVSSATTGSPPPAAIRLVLANEPGVDRVARFGPVVGHSDSGPGTVSLYDPHGVTSAIRSLEIYRVLPAREGEALVTTYPLSDGIRLSGGPQAMLALADSGEFPHLAVTLSGDELGPTFKNTTWVVSDTQQRRATTYTSLYDNVSYLLSPGETAAGTLGQPKQWIVVPGTRHETVSSLTGVSSVAASSYGPLFTSVPGLQPLAALLPGTVGSMWQASPTDRSPWIEIRFLHPLRLHEVTITPGPTEPMQTDITKVRISTDRGQVTSMLASEARPQSVPTPVGETRRLRITLVGLKEPKTEFVTGPAISHILIPGLTVAQSWKVPDDGSSSAHITPTYLFTSPMPNQLAFFKTPDDQVNMSRTFTVPRAATFLVGGEATPRISPFLYAREFPSPAQPLTSEAELKAPFVLPCGSGPTVTMDGVHYPTAVSGTMGDFYALRPMSMTPCPGGRALTLLPGTHTFTAGDDSGSFKITSLLLIGTPLQQLGPPRSVTVVRWGAEDRTVTASAGPAAIVNVHQNFSSGWMAMVNGRRLHAVRLEGWQQGWILPASSQPQVVDMHFTPEEPFRLVLGVGGVLALVLAVWSLLTLRRRHLGEAVAMEAAPSRGLVDTGEAVEGSARSAPPMSVLRGLSWAVFLGATVFLIAGPVALAVPPLIVLGRIFSPRHSWLAWTAFGGALLAGVTIAINPAYLAGPWIGTGSYTSQALAGLAVGALGVSLLGGPRARPDG
ncbi:MAG TPA: alpha-(1-_3)-arabinofuranosyltransferase family protein [Acidimicrobiales bacterium]|nr:alpha-(1->3)-arabinofuranosyltransferase family protein [Acidimicrobiales bacterium]